MIWNLERKDSTGKKSAASKGGSMARRMGTIIAVLRIAPIPAGPGLGERGSVHHAPSPSPLLIYYPFQNFSRLTKASDDSPCRSPAITGATTV